MPSTYSKIARLAKDSSVDYSDSVLAKGCSGHDWQVDHAAGAIIKRAGLRPTFTVPSADDATCTWVEPGSGLVLSPPVGVEGASTFSVPFHARRYPWYTVSSGGISWKRYRDEREVTFVAAGRLWSVRYVPAIVVVSSALHRLSYTLEPDSTGQLVFSFYIDDALQSSLTITSSTPVSSVASSITGATATAVTSLGQQGLLATCLRPTFGSKQYSNAPNSEALVIEAALTFEVPLSNPWLSSAPSDVRPRLLYTSPNYHVDTPVASVQYDNWLLFGGKNDRLVMYDGFRASTAAVGSGVFSASVVAGPGTTGVYGYLLRTKYTAPDGTVSYGTVTSLSATTANNKVSFAYYSPITLSYVASNASGSGRSIAAPERGTPIATVSPFSSGFTVPTTSTDIRLQVGETVMVQGSKTSVSQVPARQFVVSAYNEDTRVANVSSLDSSLSSLSLSAGNVVSIGETVEIFRTLAGGSTYYFLDEIPFVSGGLDFSSFDVGTVPATAFYTDSTSDGTLATHDQYDELAYTPIAPPEVVSSVTVHQGRAVVTGGYIDNTNSLFMSAVDDSKKIWQVPPINTVCWTEPGTMTFTADNSTVMTLSDGDELVASCSFDDTLYVGSRASIWAITGTLSGAATDFNVDRLPNGPGLVSNCAFAVVRSNIFGLSRSGVFSLAQRAVDYAVGQPINPLIEKMPESRLRCARLLADEKNACLYVVIPKLGSTRTSTVQTAISGGGTAITTYLPTTSDSVVVAEQTSDVFVLDLLRMSWTVLKPGTPIAGGGVALDGSVTFLPKKDANYATTLDPMWGYDAWEAVKMRFEGPWEDLDDPATHKQFVRTQVLSADGAVQNFSLDVSTEIDWKSGRAVNEFELGFRSGTGYGEQAYGSAPYGDMNETDHVRSLSNQKAKSMRLVLSNDDPGENPSISGWVIEVADYAKNTKET